MKEKEIKQAEKDTKKSPKKKLEIHGSPVTYFAGVGREAKRIRWPKKDQFLPSIAIVIAVAVFAAVFLVLEDLASGTIIEQLKKAFELIR